MEGADVGDECHCYVFTQQVKIRTENFEIVKFSHLYVQTTADRGENFSELVAHFNLLLNKCTGKYKTSSGLLYALVRKVGPSALCPR